MSPDLNGIYHSGYAQPAAYPMPRSFKSCVLETLDNNLYRSAINGKVYHLSEWCQGESSRQGTRNKGYLCSVMPSSPSYIKGSLNYVSNKNACFNYGLSSYQSYSSDLCRFSCENQQYNCNSTNYDFTKTDLHPTKTIIDKSKTLIYSKIDDKETIFTSKMPKGNNIESKAGHPGYLSGELNLDTAYIPTSNKGCKQNLVNYNAHSSYIMESNQFCLHVAVPRCGYPSSSVPKNNPALYQEAFSYYNVNQKDNYCKSKLNDKTHHSSVGYKKDNFVRQLEYSHERIIECDKEYRTSKDEDLLNSSKLWNITKKFHGNNSKPEEFRGNSSCKANKRGSTTIWHPP